MGANGDGAKWQNLNANGDGAKWQNLNSFDYEIFNNDVSPAVQNAQ